MVEINLNNINSSEYHINYLHGFVTEDAIYLISGNSNYIIVFVEDDITPMIHDISKYCTLEDILKDHKIVNEHEKIVKLLRDEEELDIIFNVK